MQFYDGKAKTFVTEYVAKYDDRSMNWYLLHLIKNEIADFEEKHGEIPTASDSKTE